jgi:hypothetical protein
VVGMSTPFAVRIEWLDAPGVTTPELAATWARYEVWLGTRCVTQVETADGNFRRSVYGSLYPFASWIAANWWLLGSHVRPSAVEARYWTWRNVQSYPWLRQHNVRGAGDGMAWPDLTLVPEGSMTRLVWSPDTQDGPAPVRFASGGNGLVRTSDFLADLATLVNHVLERLAEAGLPKTSLAEDWSEIAKTSAEEQEFCRTSARLGLDPYAIDDETADTIIEVAQSLPAEIMADFFDSADADGLAAASYWAKQAVVAAENAAGQADESLRSAYSLVNSTGTADAERPWTFGYSMARRLRHELSLADTDRFDVSPWVGLSDVNAPSHGIYGLATVRDDRCGMVLGSRGIGSRATRFGQARALGRALTHPEQQRFVLSTARSDDERVARAFAAELLAPSAGIRAMLDTIGSSDESALEAVAQQYAVSPLVVRHQYDNQVAASRYDA